MPLHQGRSSRKQALAAYLEVDRGRSLGQIASVVVPYVGVCEPLPRTGQAPSQQGMGEVVLPNGNSITSVG